LSGQDHAEHEAECAPDKAEDKRLGHEEGLHRKSAQADGTRRACE
jgi:hypothetical protein